LWEKGRKYNHHAQTHHGVGKKLGDLWCWYYAYWFYKPFLTAFFAAYLTPAGYTERATSTDTPRTSSPQLILSAVKEDVGVFSFNRAVAPFFHAAVDFFVEGADRSRAYAAFPEGFGDALHGPYGDAGKYISTNASSTEHSRRRYRSIMAVSKGSLRSLGIRSVTSPARVCSFRFIAAGTTVDTFGTANAVGLGLQESVQRFLERWSE
jgi:hypothetical protein